MVALKVLGYRMEQFESLVCPAQWLGMKRWVTQSGEEVNLSGKFLVLLARWLSRARSFWNLLRIWDSLKNPEESRTGFWQWKIMTNSISNFRGFLHLKIFFPRLLNGRYTTSLPSLVLSHI